MPLHSRTHSLSHMQLDVPVLWRPLHEAYGGWFWWGACGPKAFEQLWRLMFTRFTQVHQLHNLIWVYTADPAGLRQHSTPPCLF